MEWLEGGFLTSLLRRWEVLSMIRSHNHLVNDVVAPAGRFVSLLGTRVPLQSTLRRLFPSARPSVNCVPALRPPLWGPLDSDGKSVGSRNKVLANEDGVCVWIGSTNTIVTWWIDRAEGEGNMKGKDAEAEKATRACTSDSRAKPAVANGKDG